MAEYLIQDSTLSGIANKVRATTGTSGAMTPAQMQDDLDTFNTDMATVVNEQDNLIAQITTALEGKMAPESNKTVSVTNSSSSMSAFYYVSESGTIAFADRGETVNAIGGFVWAGDVTLSGDYIQLSPTTSYFYDHNGARVDGKLFCFLSDGGIVLVGGMGGGSN